MLNSLSTYLSTYMPVNLVICLSPFKTIYLSIYLSIYHSLIFVVFSLNLAQFSTYTVTYIALLAYIYTPLTNHPIEESRHTHSSKINPSQWLVLVSGEPMISPRTARFDANTRKCPAEWSNTYVIHCGPPCVVLLYFKLWYFDILIQHHTGYRGFSLIAEWILGIYTGMNTGNLYWNEYWEFILVIYAEYINVSYI